MRKMCVFRYGLLFIFATFFALVPLVSAGLDDGLFMYHDFDDGRDKVASNYNMTANLTASLAVADGLIGSKGITLAAVDFFDMIPGGESENDFDWGATKNYTMSIWIRTGSIPFLTNQILYKKIPGGGFDGWVAYIDNTKHLSYNDDAISYYVVSPDETLEGTWVHFLLRGNDTEICLFVNGDNKDCDAKSGSQDSSAMLTLGRPDGLSTNNFIGDWDEFGVWNRSLSDEEITSLYASGDGITYPFTPNLLNPTKLDFEVDSEVNFTAEYIAISSTLKNATYHIYNSSGLFNESFFEISGNENTTDIQITMDTIGNYHWSATQCETDHSCFTSENKTFFWGIGDLTLNLPLIPQLETATYITNVSFNVTSGSPSAKFIFGSVENTGTITNLYDDYYLASYSFDLPVGITTDESYWQLTLNGIVTNTSSITHGTTLLNWSLCDASNTVEYLNLTFANETTNQESVEATLSSAWTYWLGTGSETKSYSYSDATENAEYTFCLDPGTETLHNDIQLTYENDESQPRGYAAELTLTNSTTQNTLFLLPSSEGLFITISVVNILGAPIENALITFTDTDFSGTLESRRTGAAGTSTFFLDPFNTYVITVQAAGYPTFTESQMFTSGSESYVITLGEGSNVTDYSSGVTYSISPTDAILSNQTDYNFVFDIDSELENLDSYHFYIWNGTDILATKTGTSSGGSSLSTTVNTGTAKEIIMYANYTVGGETQKITRLWIVRDQTGTQWSIVNLANRFSQYFNPASGDAIFGITAFARGLIVFFIVFLITGVLSFKYGLNSPIAISSIVFALVAFFDVALGLFPNPVNAVPNFPTVITGLVMIALIIREVAK